MGSDAKERLLSMNPWVDLDWPERCKQAAARITELEAALSAATASAEAAEAEAARLREALEPFAQHAGDYEPPEGDDDQRIWGDWLPTIGDLRRARAALGGDHG